MEKDGHIHTTFCPHGTKDTLEGYVERAISLGFQEISFTEHAPLPKGFTDAAPTKDSSMKLEELELYFEEVARVKSIYLGQIRINTGLEVDFIEGFEHETTSFLNTYGKFLDDAILSVHFLRYGSDYDCLDYSPEVFNQMIKKYGSSEKIYECYFKTLLLSIHSDLGPFKPKRIGHMTLVKKFQKKFPIERDFTDLIQEVLDAIRNKGYELDYNGAGVSKPLCREPYPPDWVVMEAIKRGIPLVYGSDSHQIKDLGQGLDLMRFMKEV
ncbi:histidinol-phosphatase HisJ [Cytobacillus depressus]|uniref:Histidinol-phosphatase n=1 Tax=Cytobacillus depressus TaxID=1602942 RepID=A0A6L3VD22_9BACI|nr:histidinol-phosphatase HisJ [Cytobacillus depressus]KAB2338849.1 histidinol-phosphatase HisJ [Cytobacillus depressus]